MVDPSSQNSTDMSQKVYLLEDIQPHFMLLSLHLNRGNYAYLDEFIGRTNELMHSAFNTFYVPVPVLSEGSRSE